MNIHIVVQTYSNGVSTNKEVFSSERKAVEHIEWILDTEEKHGWKVSKNWLLTHEGYMAHKIEKGEPRNTMLYHIEKHEVK